jgi:hypothetical protein
VKLRVLPGAAAARFAAARHPLDETSGEDPAVLGEEVDQSPPRR